MNVPVNITTCFSFTVKPYRSSLEISRQLNGGLLCIDLSDGVWTSKNVFILHFGICKNTIKEPILKS